jgi:hypothetical protein
MNRAKGNSTPRFFSYPGAFRDYSRQAIIFSVVFSIVLFVLLLLLLAFDKVVFGRMHLTALHFTMFGIMMAATVIITQLMARSLAGFLISTDESDLTVRRGGSQMFIPYRNISAIDRVRIPGWWPLRPDMKPRCETSRIMIRIRHDKGQQLTFISGLTGENKLIEKIQKLARLEEEP